MKILVVYYSRHGHTQKTAQIIAKLLKADVESIKDKENRDHLVNWRINAFDEKLHQATQIEPPLKNPSDYDLVVVGTPIWDGISPAIKSYLSKNNFKKVAFFITFHSAAEDAGLVMSQLSHKKPIAVLEIQDLQVTKREGGAMIKKFCQQIKQKI